MLISPDVRDAINAKITKAELRNLVYKSDVISLLQDGLQKVVNGTTSIDEILRVIDVDDDIGESDIELKNAFIGRTTNHTEPTKEVAKEPTAAPKANNTYTIDSLDENIETL